MAVLAALSLGGAINLLPQHAAHAADEQGPSKKNSAKGAKALKAIQEDIKAKKWEDAKQKLQALEGQPDLTPYDKHIMYDFFFFVDFHTNDLAGTAKYMEKEINDGYLDQAEIAKRMKDLVPLYYQLKDYDKVIELGQRAIKDGYADDKIDTAVAQAYYIKGDYKGTLKFTRELVDGEIKRGETPREPQLELILSSCVKLDDNACQTRALERMVEYYPKPDYWQNLVFSLFQNKAAEASDRDTLDIYRLASDVDAINKPNEYTEMAQLALEQGSPGEAEHILERAFSKNVFTDQRERDRNQRLLEAAKKAAATDQAGLPKQEKEAEAAATGQKDVGVGIGYLSYQQYDKAAELIAHGLMKGGVKDEPQARLLLGIAQFKAGKKDDAIATFKQVKGDPTLERLANLWALHARESNRVANR
ncbi:MAG TPA: tetratricopeptide repeat protein [Steroidobacteraceae bacterium]|nr:tetratricopeptide repeat protein [Steroidobacteraceae bacterium]